jgi:hypothetical protein
MTYDFGWMGEKRSVLRGVLAGGLLLAALWLSFVPTSVMAWETTEQSAIQLADDTWLFQVTYRFAFLNRETVLPILANRLATPDPTIPTVQYDIVDGAGNSLHGVRSTAIVLSDTPLVDRQYFLPEATPGFMTLMAVVQLSPEQVAAGGEAQLRINWLPFTLIREGESQLSRVPTDDLVSYVTPRATWPAQGK